MSSYRRSLVAQTITRREMLVRGMLGASALSCALGNRAAWAAQSNAARSSAKSVIQIWMWGGPSHLDTFDPKPGAGYDYCGPLNEPIATNVDGVQIGQLLPLLAQRADKYSIIRSMTHENNSHETASYMVQTGHVPGRVLNPSLGALVALFKGYERGYDGLIPPYVVLTELQGRFSEAGFLGPRYKPFATGGDPAQQRFAVEGIVSKTITDERQRTRRDLMHTLDALGRIQPTNPQFARMDECEENAYNLILGDARTLFDLSTEKAELRERYGKNTFGQSCLMARRLVEQGVPYVTINYKGWDTHKQHFETMRRKLPELDKGLSTLLQDLSDRGLLDSTIVWWGGEFGRTPKVQWEAPWNGGRGHFGACFSALVAGGGFKGGHVIGASDATGQSVADRPVYPCDLLGSICMRLGIDPDSPLPNTRGLELAVMPAAKGASGGLLTEIM